MQSQLVVVIRRRHCSGPDGTSGGSAYLNFYEPGSSSSYTSCYISSNTSCPVTTPVGGTWKATLDANSASVGSLTLTMR